MRPLYCKPCPEAERDDEIWFGQGVEVLEELEDGWLRVRTCYGYESYLEARYIGEEPQGEPWMVLSPGRTCWQPPSIRPRSC